MNFKALTPVDIIFFLPLIFLTLMSLYQAWENLIRKRVSKYSYDAFLIFISSKFASPENHRRTLQFSRDPKRLFMMGVFAFLVFVGGVQATYMWYVKIILPGK